MFIETLFLIVPHLLSIRFNPSEGLVFIETGEASPLVFFDELGFNPSEGLVFIETFCYELERF